MTMILHENHVNNTRPNVVGTRTILAKTCTKCGLFLSAQWFRRKPNKRWFTKCRKCESSEQSAREQYSKMPYEKNTYAKQFQDITKEFADRQGETLTPEDLHVIKTPGMSTLEKALFLGRTYYAIHTAEVKNKVEPRVARLPLDMITEQWVITFRSS